MIENFGHWAERALTKLSDLFISIIFWLTFIFHVLTFSNLYNNLELSI